VPKITKKVVDGLVSKGEKPAFAWDDSLTGFGVKALPSGAKRYVIKYRANGGGRAAPQRWLTVGSHGPLTCDQARAMAQQLLAAVARGEDPQLDKFNRRTAPNVEDVWSRFESDYLPMRKPQTRREYESQWRDVLKPRFGKTAVSDLSRTEVDKLHKSLRDTPYRANRILALCSRLMSLSEAWGWRAQGTNPCRYVQRYAERSRTRYLRPDELVRIGASMRQLMASGEVQPSAVNAIKLLVLTGARLNEILLAKWDWVAWDKQIIALPDSKTGEKPIYLSQAALSVLKEQKEIAAGREFVFPGRSVGCMVNLRKPWTRVCADAGIQGVRLHDLRHTAASIAVGQGASLPIVGRLLGHTQAQTTLRYAHIDADPALRAADQIGDAIGGAFGV
jgi:integrase